MREQVRINEFIRAAELRVILEDGTNLGVLDRVSALKEARNRGLDLIEISPNAVPPIAKITDHGKYLYKENKKAKESRARTHNVEIKSIQVKVGTGDHDLELKARKASEFLAEGNRVKIELFLRGRAKYMDKKFLEERLKRILALITEEYKVTENPAPSPKGMMIVLEKNKK